MTSSTFLNTYQRPPAPTLKGTQPHLDTPSSEYDFNFCFDVTPLESPRVQLRPFVPSLYAREFFEKYSQCDKDISKWLIKYETLDDFLVWLEITIRLVPGAMPYALFTKPLSRVDEDVPSEEYELAGMISLINSDVGGMTSELGWIMIFDQYQRTHVLSNAAGLVMHRILDMPSQGGLGLRRCQWLATTLNEKSKAAAQRLGFTHEGNLRAHRVLAVGRQGIRPGRKGDYREECMTRDTWISSISWDQWEDSIRNHVDKLMARTK